MRTLKFSILIFILTIIAITVAFGAYYVIYSRYIKLFGITLTPTRDFPPFDITYYLQNDPLWSTDSIGNTSFTMGGAGCLITCVAVSLNVLGTAVTPQELNKNLTEINGYQNAELIWYKINEAFPSINYRYKRIFSSRTIEKDLMENRLPIVNVRFNGSGITHWVIVIGAKDGDFLVFDPLNKNRTPIPLSTHGKVYAYRTLHVR